MLFKRWLKMRGIFTSGVLAFLLAVLLFTSAAFAAPVFNLSDVHFDPFADPSLVGELAAAPAVEWESILSRSGAAVATWGEETNSPLLDSALDAMRAASPQPALMFFTGDVLAHKFETKYHEHTGDDSQEGLRSFIYKTMDYVISKVADAFPGVPVYYILGNNDAYDGDYAVAPEGAFLRDMGELLADRFLQSQDDRHQFLPTFTQGGYYSLALPGDSSTRVIGMNSTFFSVEYNEPDETRPDYDPAWQELEWLETQLETARARGERAWLLTHIPPGVHVHKAVNDSGNSLSYMTDAPTFWHPAYSTLFMELLDTYSDVVAAVMCGHTHMDDFRVVMDGDISTLDAYPRNFMHINPALSPQRGNNPSFKLLEADLSRLTFENVQGYAMNLDAATPAWSQLYDFNQTFGLDGMNANTLNWVRNRMGWDTKIADDYMLHYTAGNTVSPFEPDQLRAYWTGITQFEPEGFLSAYNRGWPGPPLP